MQVCINGSVCPYCQIGSLREGFEELGHIHTDDWRSNDVGFVFVGNGPYTDYIEAAKNREKNIIFNALDIPVQNPNVQVTINEFREALPHASKVTAISEYTQWQLKEHCNVDSEVIYYPMKPVFFTNVKKYPEIKVLICGRVNDSNKRVGSAISALVKAGYDERNVAIVGPENPRWGVYHGVVSDEKLNDMYNSADYVIMLDKVAGIGLPAIEAACAGAIPIIAPDLTTYQEFWAKSPMSLFYQTFTSIEKIAEGIRYFDNNPDEKRVMKEETLKYADIYLRPKFDKVEVAKRIYAVYQTI